MKRRIESPETRTTVALLARALRPFVDGAHFPTHAALELARNAALALADGLADPHVVLDEMIRHRVKHGWITCGDIQSASACGARAWTLRASRIAQQSVVYRRSWGGAA